jgi:hypothetical protein
VTEGVNALEVDRGRAELGVPEMAPHDVQRHALAGELERVGVARLVRREPASEAGACGEPVEAARAAASTYRAGHQAIGPGRRKAAM